MSQLSDAWMGSMAGPDHLYPNCPILQQTTPWGDHGWPRQALGRADPHGTDICGWCVRVWDARHRKEQP